MRARGSFKNVLPVLVLKLSYKELEIAGGGAAMDAYHQMCAAKDKPEVLVQIRDNLLAYCKLDTLAMVRILNHLGDLI